MKTSYLTKLTICILFFLTCCNKTYTFPLEGDEIPEEPQTQVIIVNEHEKKIDNATIQKEVKDTVKLKPPIIFPSSSLVPYGEKIIATAQPSSEIEYSYDNGLNWYKFTSIKIASDIKLLFRVRQNNLVSEISTLDYKVYFKKVIVLGNSILQHLPLPEKGWNGNWGMAATAPEKDFFNIIKNRLIEKNNNVEIKTMNISNFEIDFQGYNISNLNDLAAFDADLIIIRIGDNVDAISAFNNGFGDYYRKLVLKLTSNSVTPPKLICTGSFFKLEYVDYEILRGLKEPIKASWVNLAKIREIGGTTAINEYKDLGIGSHPSDKGMKAIADSIWAKI